MRGIFFALCLATVAAGGIAIAQMPAEIPGKPDPARVTGGRYVVDAAHTQVAFTVNHLGFNAYHGLFGDITGSLTLDPAKPEKAALSITVPMSGITTTSAKLTEHMQGADFFEAAKFPTATFQSTAVTVSGTSAMITGNLTIRGITKPVTLDARFIGAGANPMSKAETVGFEATTKIRRSDFGMTYGIPFVTDEVALEITAAFEKPAV